MALAESVISFFSSHPKAAIFVLSIFGSLIFKNVVTYSWHRQIYKRKLRERVNKAEQRKRTVKEQSCDKSLADDAYKTIANKTVCELQADIKSGKLTVVQVLHAFQRKALEVTQKINCVVEPITEAEKQAQLLDSSAEKDGLLYGIPVSVKESISVTGYDPTAGISLNIGNIARDDAVVVKVLKKHGAIPFVRTNIPQTMLSYCCSNPLYGETLNPQDMSRSPGGSSGGEGAVLGGGGSVVGVGTDIGGSLRVPAEFCGVYALKPTKGRISSKGVYTFSRGNLAIQSTLGPMARDFDSLLVLSRVLMSPEMIELDRALPNLPFNLKEFEKTSPLRIGFYTYDGTCLCQPPIVRAVTEATEALKRMGHDVVPFDFPRLLGHGFQNVEYFIRLMTADRGEKLRRILGYDNIEPAVLPLVKLGKMPRWLLRCLQYLVGLKDQQRGAIIGAALGFRSIYDYFTHVAKFMDWQESFMKAWMEEGLDAVICPVFPSPAVTREIIPQDTASGLYCQMYNSLNYPSGVIPVTHVTQEDLNKTFDQSVFSPRSFNEYLQLKSSKGSEGLSVGVQCVALPFKEEICLRVMRDIKQGLEKAAANGDEH